MSVTCERCRQLLQVGDLYAPVFRVVEQPNRYTGRVEVVVGHGDTDLVAHLECPPLCDCPLNGYCSKCKHLRFNPDIPRVIGIVTVIKERGKPG